MGGSRIFYRRQISIIAAIFFISFPSVQAYQLEDPPRLVVNISPQDPTQACFQKGLFYKDRGEHEEAIVQFRKAIALNPNHLGAYFYAGLIRQEKGQFRMAIYNFKKALKDSTYEKEAGFHLSQIYEKLGQKEKAARYQPKEKVQAQDNPVDQETLHPVKRLYPVDLIPLTSPLSVANRGSQASQRFRPPLFSNRWLKWVALFSVFFIPIFLLLGCLYLREKRINGKRARANLLTLEGEEAATYSISDFRKKEFSEPTTEEPTVKGKYAVVNSLAAQGLGVREIAKKLNIGQGEVQLAIDLWKRQRPNSDRTLRFRFAY